MEEKQSGEGSFNLQLQIVTLKESLVELSAQKSRMEASFKADEKQIRNELLLRDKTISELLEYIKELNKRHAVDLKAKKSLIMERQEREEEKNEYMLYIRDLKKLYEDERHLKENLEMQLKDLKTQFSSVDDSGLKYQELTTEQYAVAFVTEQRQTRATEDRSNLAVLLEKRVESLEARLVELSTTVGTYDRLRQQDQKIIRKLKDKIDAKEKTKKSVPAIVEEIMQLKKLLIIENIESDIPVDISKIFITDAVHAQCMKDKDKLQEDLNACQLGNAKLKKKVENQKRELQLFNAKLKIEA